MTARKQVEEALYTSEEQFRSAFNYAAIGMALVALDGHWLQVNHALSELTGYSPSELLTKTFHDITHPDDLDTDLNYVQKLLNGEIESYQLEKRYFHKDGHEVWVLLSMSLVRDSSRQPLHFVAQVQNITPRKQAETALAAERNLLRTLLDSMPNDVFVKDIHSRFITANQAALASTGLKDLSQLVGKTDFDFFPTALAQTFYEDEQSIMASGQAQVNHENMGFDPQTGHEVCYWTTKVPLRDEHNTITGIVGISWDITERKHIENTLKAKIAEEQELHGYLKALHEITIELTNIDDIDLFYKCAVELGRQRLGFDRLGLLLYDADQEVALGTYGTNAAGLTNAEHHLRVHPSQLTSILMRALQDDAHFAVDEDTQLYDQFELIGTGWNAAAVLWSGSDKLGWLTTDNGVQHKPMRQLQLNLLAFYALTLGTLLAQKRVQLSLQQNERQFRLLAQNSPDIIYIMDVNQRRIVYLNRPTLLGYTRSEVESSELIFQALHPDDAPRVYTHWSQTIVGSKLEDFSTIDYRLRDKSGKWRWLQSREAIFTSTPDGRPSQVLVTLTDITDRKQAEEDLKQERDVLRTLIDSSPDHIFIKDSSGHFTLSNMAQAQAVKLVPDKLVGKTAFDVYPLEMAQQYQADDQRVLQAGETLINLERQTIGSDGTPRTVLTTKIPLRNTDGHIMSLVGISRDITERKQLEAQTIELAAERKRLHVMQHFIRDMSHDFRTPLTIMNTSLYLLQRAPEAQQRHIQKIEQQIARIENLLEEFLQMEYLDEGEVKFEFSPTELNLFLAPLVRTYSPIAAIRGITVEFIPVSRICYARIDPREFAIVITKLMDNAVAYTSQGGSITVRLTTQDHEAIIAVQDTGIGIAPHDLPHLFEHFYRADRSRSSQTGGNGLGLPIAKKIVDAHQGTMEVESVVGQGSTFTVRLPLG